MYEWFLLSSNIIVAIINLIISLQSKREVQHLKKIYHKTTGDSFYIDKSQSTPSNFTDDDPT